MTGEQVVMLMLAVFILGSIRTSILFWILARRI